MTDNYQIDKNSKLYQKFLNLKINKHNDNSVEKVLNSSKKIEMDKNTSKIMNDNQLQ